LSRRTFRLSMAGSLKIRGGGLMRVSRTTLAASGTLALIAIAAAGTAQAFQDPPFSAPGVPKPGYPAFVAGADHVTLTRGPTTDSASAANAVYTLSISATTQNVGLFNFPSAAYIVGGEQLKLTAHFDATGHLLTNLANTFEVDGSLKAWGSPDFGTKPAGFSWTAQPVEKLFSVSLANIAVDSTHEAIGFTTTNFGGWANQKQFTGGGTPSESLWLYSLLGSALLPTAGMTDPTVAYTYGTTNSAWNTFLSELKNHTQLKTGTFYNIGAVATVPLPAAIWLLGGGLAALGAFRRRSLTERGATAA
jgi:hypothetical protein